MPEGMQFQPEDARPHVDTRTCGRCRRPLEKGHRVTTAMIVEGPGLNPKNLGQTGLMLSGEYELVHINCHDPFLRRGIVGGGL